MRILITNDDGLNSHGMLHLEAELSALGEVWAVAPDRERSATSMAISIREPLKLTKESPRRYRVSGFPVDCVNVCLFAEGFPEFDLVVSGINHGYNLGDDVHYSGTVGAARHAALHGRRAIAVSAPIRSPQGDFRRVAGWLAQWLRAQLHELNTGVVYNVNYPEEVELRPDHAFPAWRCTAQGRRRYYDQYSVLEEGPDHTLIRLAETELGHHLSEGSDFEAVEAGFVSVTPLALDQTHSQERQRWKAIADRSARNAYSRES